MSHLLPFPFLPLPPLCPPHPFLSTALFTSSFPSHPIPSSTLPTPPLLLLISKALDLIVDVMAFHSLLDPALWDLILQSLMNAKLVGVTDHH